MGIRRSEQEIEEVWSRTGTGSRSDNDKQTLTNLLYIGNDEDNPLVIIRED